MQVGQARESLTRVVFARIVRMWAFLPGRELFLFSVLFPYVRINNALEVLVHRKLARCIGWSFAAAWSIACTASTPIAIAWCACRSAPFAWRDAWEISTIGTVVLGSILTLWFLDHVGDAWKRARTTAHAGELDDASAALRHLVWHTCIPLLCWTYGPRLLASGIRHLPKLRAFRRARSQ